MVGNGEIIGEMMSEEVEKTSDKYINTWLFSIIEGNQCYREKIQSR